MSIEQTPAISALTQVTKREPQDIAPTLRDKKIAEAPITKESSFSLSEVQKKLLQPQPTDINSAKVERIKQAIKNDTLQMDAGKVADGILRDAHECMLSMKSDK